MSLFFESDNLTLGYGNQLVIKNLDISLNFSKNYEITGKNGSGKTTLCAKISSYILDNLLSANEKHKLSVLNFSQKSSEQSELLNFGKLLNLNVASV